MCQRQTVRNGETGLFSGRIAPAIERLFCLGYRCGISRREDRRAGHQVNQTACRSLAFWRARCGARHGGSRGMHMIRHFVAIAGLALAAASGPVFAQTHGNAAVAAAVASFERISRHYDPLTSSGEGDRAALRLLPDASPQTQAALRAELVTLKNQIEQIPATGLSDDDAINRTFMLREVNQGIES